MTNRTFLPFSAGILLAAMFGLTTSTAFGQTPLPNGFEISLPAGFTHEKLQGFDSIVGQIVQKDGLQIKYEMGSIPPPGAPRFGGSFTNYAQQVPEKDRQWLKELTVGGRKISAAYNKEQMLFVTSASATEGVNFHVTAKTPGEVADVLLIVLSLTGPKAK